jgi:hypothetical protein
MHKQLWGYKVEEKIYMGVRERKKLNITGLGGYVEPRTGLGILVNKSVPMLRNTKG